MSDYGFDNLSFDSNLNDIEKKDNMHIQNNNIGQENANTSDNISKISSIKVHNLNNIENKLTNKISSSNISKIQNNNESFDSFKISSGEIGSLDGKRKEEIQHKNINQENLSESPIINESINSEVMNRNGFIRKVFVLFGIQLIISVISSIFPVFYNLYNFHYNHFYLFILFLILGMAILGLLCASRSVSMQFPINYILLAIFSLCGAYVCNFLSAMTDPETVLAGLSITAFVVVGLFVLAYIISTKFTLMLAFILCILLNVLMFGFFMIFFYSRPLNLLYIIIATISFSIYLIIDIHLIIGKGNAKYDLNDYVGASVSIYIDVIFLLFLIIRALKS